MFDKAYQGTMRQGSRLLFAIAVVLFVAGLVQWVLERLPLGFGNQFQPSGIGFIPALLNALSYCVWPLFGALIVDRLDRWLAGSRPNRTSD